MIYKLLLDGFDIFNQQDDRKLLNSNVSIELNAAGSCEFTMPVSHRYYDLVSLLIQTLEIYDENNTVIWFGRPTEITTDFYNQKKVYFEGPMAFFGDTIQRPVEQFNYSVRQFFRDLITAHNAQVTDTNRQFTVGNITIPDRAVYRKTDYETTKECLERMCIDAEGGYIFFRRESGVNYIDWLDAPSINASQPIMYSMNLKDIEQNLNCDELGQQMILDDFEAEASGSVGLKVVFNGKSTSKLREKELAQLRLDEMGFIFQQMYMLKNLSVLDNIILPARQSKANTLSPKEKLERGKELMRKLGIIEIADNDINEVSGGQLQRACICRSMINNPKIIFADEPTGALNRASSDEVMDELCKINGNGTTVMLVTHDAKVAARCGRVLFIVDGNIKGEYNNTETDPRKRDRALNNWLMEMGF